MSSGRTAMPSGSGSVLRSTAAGHLVSAALSAREARLKHRCCPGLRWPSIRSEIRGRVADPRLPVLTLTRASSSRDCHGLVTVPRLKITNRSPAVRLHRCRPRPRCDRSHVRGNGGGLRLPADREESTAAGRAESGSREKSRAGTGLITLSAAPDPTDRSAFHPGGGDRPFIPPVAGVPGRGCCLLTQGLVPAAARSADRRPVPSGSRHTSGASSGHFGARHICPTAATSVCRPPGSAPTRQCLSAPASPRQRRMAAETVSAAFPVLSRRWTPGRRGCRGPAGRRGRGGRPWRRRGAGRRSGRGSPVACRRW